MKATKWIQAAIFTQIIWMQGCLASPVLEHDQAKAGIDVQARVEEPKPCPIHLESQKLCSSLTWVKQPTDEEEGEFTLRFWDEKNGDSETGPFVDPGYKVFVKLWMPSMGHGSSPVTVAQAKTESGDPITGIYQATRVHFVMGGAWEIWIHLKLEKKIIDQAKWDVQI